MENTLPPNPTLISGAGEGRAATCCGAAGLGTGACGDDDEEDDGLVDDVLPGAAVKGVAVQLVVLVPVQLLLALKAHDCGEPAVELVLVDFVELEADDAGTLAGEEAEGRGAGTEGEEDDEDDDGLGDEDGGLDGEGEADGLVTVTQGATRGPTRTVVAPVVGSLLRSNTPVCTRGRGRSTWDEKQGPSQDHWCTTNQHVLDETQPLPTQASSTKRPCCYCS